MTNTHIWLHFYLERPTFGDAQLAALQAAIVDLLPAWSAGLRVAKNESMRNATSVARDDLLRDAVLKAASPRRGLESATLKGAYEGISLFLDSCESTLPPELNHIAVEIEELTSVEGLATEEWAKRFFELLVTKLPVRYANARSDAEYQAKNIVTDGSAVRAVGTLLEKALPGVYWLTFFGRSVHPNLGRTAFDEDPSMHGKARERRHIDRIGVLSRRVADCELQELRIANDRSHWSDVRLFSRANPAEQTTAPDFRSSSVRIN